MKLTFLTPPTGGTVRAIPSKSVAHRMLICAAFADKPTFIGCPAGSADIDATAECLRALGAQIARDGAGFSVTPAAPPFPAAPLLDCGESGSTLRFLLPVAAQLMHADKGMCAHFVRHGRLPHRPLSPLYEEMIRHGAILPRDAGTEPLPAAGPMTAGEYTLAANVSSQFISGLLMSFPLSYAPCTLTLTGNIESADYIRITTDVMRRFGIRIDISPDERRYTLTPLIYRSPGRIDVEGDWSNGALWLCAAALGHAPITVQGLSPDSPQGDRRIVDVLQAFGAAVTSNDSTITVHPSRLHGISLDASQIPDLVPVIAATAAAAEGETTITGIARLRLKESDRVAAVTGMLSSLGADVEASEHTIVIRGGKRLRGGNVSSFKDHRMVMCAALAAMQSLEPITVEGAEAVGKSYPGFLTDLAALGGTFHVEE